MHEKYLIIDEGTSTTRAAIYNSTLAHADFHQLAVPLISPSPDIVEQNANIIWSQTLKVAKAAAKGQIINAIGITNQRETTIIWDRATGEPVHNAIVWQDRRGADLSVQMKMDGREKILTAKTGLVADSYFSAFKINWLLNNIKGLRTRAQNGELAFGTIDTWIIWNLTEGRVHATDASNASRTALFNIYDGKWDCELMEMFGIPPCLLPEVKESNGDFGKTTLFGGEIPINGVLGDQQAALMGQNCVISGEAKITFGTGAFLMVQLEGKPRQSSNKLLLTIASKIGDKINYAIEGTILNAGSALQWLRDEMGIIQNIADSEAMATSIVDNGGVYFVPSFSGLGSPYWNADARGMIYGLGRGTSKAHIVRAALEASAFQAYDLLEAIKKDGIHIDILRVDGGMASNNFFCQFLSDICDIIVERPNDLEMTAMGAARISMISSKSTAKLNSTRFSPQMKSELRAKNLYGWKQSIRNIMSAYTQN